MTNGPLTPPTVLYRIRGTTEYDDDSRGSPMMAQKQNKLRRGLNGFKEGSVGTLGVLTQREARDLFRN